MTYAINQNELSNLNANCSVNGEESYYNCDNGSYGFTYTDQGAALGAPLAIDIQVAAGTNCDNDQVTPTFDGQSLGGYTPPYDCNCAAQTTVIDLGSVPTAGYVVGGANTLSIPEPSCDGFIQNSAWNGAFALVRVTYPLGVATQLPDGAQCNDGNVCHIGETCLGGTCTFQLGQETCPPGFTTVPGGCRNTYAINPSELVNQNAYCTSSIEYISGSGTYGFTYTDQGAGLGAAVAVDIQVAAGVICNSTPVTPTFNGQNLASYAPPYDCNGCGAATTVLDLGTIPTSGYVVGGVNTLSIPALNSAGFNQNPNWNNGFALVTVTYSNAGAVLQCSAPDQCATVICDPTLGCAAPPSPAPDGTPCNTGACTMDVCGGGVCLNGSEPALYHCWQSPISGCATTSYDSVEPTADGGSFPFNAGDSLACKAWKLAATICNTQPTEYSDQGEWTCPSSGGFTDPTFGTFCPSDGQQYVCSGCPGACNAGCHYTPLSIRSCQGQETDQPLRPAGAACDANDECISGQCNGNCVGPASCSDGVQDDGETGVDCGGGQCVGCANGQACNVPGDCAQEACSNNVCGVGDGGVCTANSQCVSQLCTNGTCLPAHCSDGVQDDGETGVDCGGGVCNACIGGQGCNTGSDCLSGTCNGGTCTGVFRDCAVRPNGSNCEFSTVTGSAQLQEGQTADIGQTCCGSCGCVDVYVYLDMNDTCWQGVPACPSFFPGWEDPY
jgi:hypothetical protein